MTEKFHKIEQEFNKVAQKFINNFSYESDSKKGTSKFSKKYLNAMNEAVRIVATNRVGLAENILYKYIVTPNKIEIDDNSFNVSEQFVKAFMNNNIDAAAKIAARNVKLRENPLYLHIVSNREDYADTLGKLTLADSNNQNLDIGDSC